MTLDSSGNLLVAKTAVGLSTTGFQAIATGNQNAFISDGDRALILNRKTSDGAVQEFRKDGTTGGTIGDNPAVRETLLLAMMYVDSVSRRMMSPRWQ